MAVRDQARQRLQAAALGLGALHHHGQRDVLGLWVEQTEGAKFWLKVFNELKNRGCQDILIAVVDGLKGLTEAVAAAYPRTTVQTCIVHLIRNSLDYANYKERKVLAQALRPIYSAASVGREVPDDRTVVATRLGARHAVLRVPTRYPTCDLHHECH